MENNQNQEMGKGIHIISNLFGCRNPELLVNRKKLEALLTGSIEKNGLTILRKDFYQFGEEDKSGITGYMLLAESHVSLHTWPEPDNDNYIALDIFVCNYSKDNTENAKNIYQELLNAFQPTKKEEYFIPRN